MLATLPCHKRVSDESNFGMTVMAEAETQMRADGASLPRELLILLGRVCDAFNFIVPRTNTHQSAWVSVWNDAEATHQEVFQDVKIPASTSFCLYSDSGPTLSIPNGPVSARLWIPGIFEGSTFMADVSKSTTKPKEGQVSR